MGKQDKKSETKRWQEFPQSIASSLKKAAKDTVSFVASLPSKMFRAAKSFLSMRWLKRLSKNLFHGIKRVVKKLIIRDKSFIEADRIVSEAIKHTNKLVDKKFEDSRSFLTMDETTRNHYIGAVVTMQIKGIEKKDAIEIISSELEQIHNELRNGTHDYRTLRVGFNRAANDHRDFEYETRLHYSPDHKRRIDGMVEHASRQARGSLSPSPSPRRASGKAQSR